MRTKTGGSTFRRRRRSPRASASAAAARASAITFPARTWTSSTNTPTSWSTRCKEDPTFREPGQFGRRRHARGPICHRPYEAADLGVKATDIARALNIAAAGQRVSTFSEGTKQYDVVVQADEQFRRVAGESAIFYGRVSNGVRSSLTGWSHAEEARSPHRSPG